MHAHHVIATASNALTALQTAQPASLRNRYSWTKPIKNAYQPVHQANTQTANSKDVLAAAQRV